MSDLSQLKKTALYQEHLNLSGQMVDFGGWALPVRYGSIVEEHLAVRSGAGVFDVSHMGNFYLSGPDTYDCINYLISNNLNKITEMQAMYTPLLYENGTFVDDIIVYMIDRERFAIVVNASNVEKDFDWMSEQIAKNGFNCKLENLSEEKSIIAIQGNKAVGKISQLFPSHDITNPFHFSFDDPQQGKLPTMIANTGYTGEVGVEIVIDNELALELFRDILSLGITPCGLGARDSLRLEKGFSLYGHEITDQTNALEAGLGWTVSFDKDFIGKTALEKIKAEGITRRIVGLTTDSRRVPREGTEIYDATKTTKVGVVTSGGVSPSLHINIALGYVDKTCQDKELMVKIGNDFYPVERTKRVFL